MATALAEALVTVSPVLTGFSSKLAAESRLAGAAAGSEFSTAFGSRLSLGAGILAFGALAKGLDDSVKGAANLQSEMTRIQTQAGASAGEVKNATAALLGMADTGSSADKLAEGLYHVESAGFRGATALDMERQAAREAEIGHASLTQTTQAMIAIMSSGISGVHGAGDAMAWLNQTVGTGDMTMQQLTKAFSTGILPAAAAFGVGMDSVSAGLATLTDNATPANEAATRLRMTISLLGAPSLAAGKQMQSIGLTTTQLASDLRQPQGLMVAIDDLKSHLEASGLSAEQQADVIAKAFGGGRTAAGILTLMQESDRLRGKFADQGDAATRAAKMQEAWSATQKTFATQMDVTGAKIKDFSEEVGTHLLPEVGALAKGFGNNIGPIVGVTGAVAGLFAAYKTVQLGMAAYNAITNATAAAQGILSGSTRAEAMAAAQAATAQQVLNLAQAQANVTAAEEAVANERNAVTLAQLTVAENEATIAARNLITAQEAEGAASATMGSRLGGLTGIIGKAGAAMVAFGIASAVLGTNYKHSSTSQLQDDLVNLDKTGKTTDLTMRHFDEDIQAFGTGGWAKFGTSIASGLETITMTGDAADDSVKHSKQRIGELDQAMAAMVSNGHAKEAGDDFQMMLKHVKDEGGNLNDLKSALPQYEAAVTAAAEATKNSGNASGDAAHQAAVLKAQQDAAAASANMLGIAEGNMLDDLTSGKGIEDYTKNVIAADNAMQAWTDRQKSMAQAVTDAKDKETQAADAVKQANANVVTSEQAVHDAIQGVADAEDKYRQDIRATQEAQEALTNARIQATRTLEDYQRQVRDIADNEEEARIRLAEAQQEVNRTAGEDPSNLNRRKALLALDEAQHNLDDTMQNAKRTREDAAAADKKGVEGSDAVVNAKQRVSDAEKQQAKDAEGIVKARQAVTDAETKVADAKDKVREANDKLKKAEDDVTTAVKNNTDSLTMNTQAGRDNQTALLNVWDAEIKAGKVSQDNYTDFMNVATQLGINTTQADSYAKQLGLIPPSVVTQMTVQAQLDLTKLTGVDAAQANALTRRYSAAPSANGSGAIGGLSEGGPVEGPWAGPKADNVLSWVNPKEYMMQVAAHEYYGTRAMEAINHRRIPRHLLAHADQIHHGFADGGSIDEIENVANTSGIPHTVTSTYRPGARDYHGQHKAVDFGDFQYGRAVNDRFAQWWMDNHGSQLLELIHSPNWFIKNGRRVSADFYRAVYDQHFNHVHVAAQPGFSGNPNFALSPAAGPGGDTGAPLTVTAAQLAPAMNVVKGMASSLATQQALSNISIASGLGPLPLLTDFSKPYAAGQGPGAGGGIGNPAGSGVGRWRPEVNAALAANNLSQALADKVLRQIATESGGNPTIRQKIWDINMAQGDPAEGLMQTIPPTFNRWKFPGHNDILNGYDNLLAALNYAKHRYGPNLNGLGEGHGYDSGGWLTDGARKHTARPEAVLDPDQSQAFMSLVEAVTRGGSGSGTVELGGGTVRALITGLANVINHRPTQVAVNDKVLAETVKPHINDALAGLGGGW